MTTDTPRTDACPHCGYAWRKAWGMWYCGTFEQTKGMFRTELCYEREARQKAERELSALQRLRPTRDDVKKLEQEVEASKKDALKGLELADEWAAKCVKAEAEVERLRNEFLKSIARDELQKKIIIKQHDLLCEHGLAEYGN